MPNIASVLKEEIARVARKELRGGIKILKKASVQYRSDIAALKRRIASLEQQITRLGKVRASAPTLPTQTPPVRFSAKSLIAQRKRLGLSAAEMGVLVTVSAQTIYNWEAGKSRPRVRQLSAIGAVRGMGKKDALAKLKELAK